MRIIHTGDIHLGSPFAVRLVKEKAELRRAEICSTFRRLVAFATAQGVRLILLAGDVFDGDFPSARDREFFYGVIKSAPQIDFLYLKGNHDLFEEEVELPNLKRFGREWRSYEYGSLTVSGIELCAQNCESFYSSLVLDKSKTNLLLLHGQISSMAGEGLICLNRLRGKGIDYLALGHLHSFRIDRLDERGVYAYCGCLEGRGYDEAGEKGFLFLEADRLVQASFLPFACRTVWEKEVDTGGVKSAVELLQKIRSEISVPKEDLLRLVLKGECDFETEGLQQIVEDAFRGSYFDFSVKNEAVRKVDISKYAGQVSLEGEFVRLVTTDKALTEEEKNEVLRMGLKVLSGERV